MGCMDDLASHESLMTQSIFMIVITWFELWTRHDKTRQGHHKTWLKLWNNVLVGNQANKMIGSKTAGGKKGDK